MTNRLRGIHPRLVPRAPDPRPSLAVLPALRDAGDDFAWAVWYAVWRVRGEDDGEASGRGAWLDRFHAAFGCVPELDDALRTVADYLHGIGARTEAADALLRISDWALERGASEPAIQCAEAAAALVPESGRRALAAGRVNRISSEVARAALYYERAMTLARVRRKWRTYVRAHLGLGQVKKALGDPSAARAHYYTAARAARSLSGEKWLAAQTRHDLLVLATEQGAFEEALRHARQALDWYPRHHASLPALAHDLALLLVRMHAYAAALPLLKVTVPKLIPRDQVIAWSTLARAAAGIGDAAGYERATDNVLRLVGLFDLHGAAAFDNLAWGAQSLALWREAEQYASRSLDIASSRTQSEAIDNARCVLAAARAQLPPTPPPPVDERLIVSVLQVARDMAGGLTSWRGVTWKRKRQSGRERLGSV
ncbi:MAG TPA: tetratricopeptide repeat protein [Longimicrobium sp.]|nr:tetratricopeptide repeat protein [Longimicrobium sp.]